MDAPKNPFEILFDRTVEHGQSVLVIVKLKAVDKTADVGSTVLSRALLVVVLSMLAVSLNIAIGFWLGDWLGKVYFGFLLVSGFYGFLAIVIALFHPRIKNILYNSLIRQMLR
jgi:hypothetical protein